MLRTDRIVMLISIFVLALALAGCGGGDAPQSVTAGTVQIRVEWPARDVQTQAGDTIPTVTQRIDIEVRQRGGEGEGTILGTVPIIRPDTDSQIDSQATVENVRAGDGVVEANAYPNADGTGHSLAQASMDIIVPAGGTAYPDGGSPGEQIGLALASTITEVRVTPNPATVGQEGGQVQLTATALNARGFAIMVPPTGAYDWDVTSGTAHASVDDETGLVTGQSPGEATVRATENESGVSGEATVVVSSEPPPIEDDPFIIGGDVAPDPDDPSVVIVTLNAIIDPDTAMPLTGLDETNFRVYEYPHPRGDAVGEHQVIESVESVGGGTSSAADICFVVDGSGSMSREVDGVRESIEDFAQYLTGEGLDVRFAGVGYLSDVYSHIDFTSDIPSLRNWLNGLTSSGITENGVNAVKYAVDELSWRAGAQRIIVVLTDEDFDDWNGSPGLEQLINDLRGSYACHAICDREYRPDQGAPALAVGTGGTTMDLPSDGNVDLTTLPLGSTILQGYLIRFRSVPTDTDHDIRLILDIGGVPVADQFFTAHY